jgi:hypothetical protein
MANTSAQRQAQYRKRRAFAGDGEMRINAWVPSATVLALRRLARRYGVTQREMLEQLVAGADDPIISTLEPGTPAWDEYFGATVTA